MKNARPLPSCPHTSQRIREKHGSAHYLTQVRPPRAAERLEELHPPRVPLRVLIEEERLVVVLPVEGLEAFPELT